MCASLPLGELGSRNITGSPPHAAAGVLPPNERRPASPAFVGCISRLG
jgi:hypothetical protein